MDKPVKRQESGTCEMVGPIKVKTSFVKKSINGSAKKKKARRSNVHKYPQVIAKLDMSKLARAADNDYSSSMFTEQGRPFKNRIVKSKTLKAPKAFKQKNKSISGIYLRRKLLNHKLENPSENHRNTPVDEYSESSHFIQGQEANGSISERNHYYSKIDVSHAEIKKGVGKSNFQKYVKRGQNSSRVENPRGLHEFNTELSSVSHGVIHTSKDDSKDILIIENKTIDNRESSPLDFKKYLTKTEPKPETNKALPVHKKLESARAKFKQEKYSTGIENRPVNNMKRLPPKRPNSPADKKDRKLAQCRSVNDLRHIGGCTELLCDCSYSSKNLKKMKGNLKDFRDLKVINDSLAKQLEEKQSSLKEAHKQVKILESEKERLNFEVQKLKFHNTQMEKSLAINNNSDEIQHVITELSSMLLNTKKKLNINRRQRDLIQNLFGDIGTKTLKDRIVFLEEKFEARTKELIEMREEFKNFMGSYLDEIQRFESPRVLISTVEDKLASNKVRFNPRILQECVTESTSEGTYVQLKLDILNRLQELNEEVSSKDGFGSNPGALNSGRSKDADHDTFLMEMEYLESMSLKAPSNMPKIKESKLELTDDNLLSKPSFCLESSRTPRGRKSKAKRMLVESDVIQMMYCQSKCMEESLNAIY